MYVLKNPTSVCSHIQVKIDQGWGFLFEAVFVVHEVQAMWRFSFMHACMHACAQPAYTASDRTPPFICAMVMVSRLSASRPSDKADGDNVNFMLQGPGFISRSLHLRLTK
jgi:hypothetical protein